MLCLMSFLCVCAWGYPLPSLYSLLTCRGSRSASLVLSVTLRFRALLYLLVLVRESPGRLCQLAWQAPPDFGILKRTSALWTRAQMPRVSSRRLLPHCHALLPAAELTWIRGPLKDLFHPSAKRQNENEFANTDMKKCIKKEFQRERRINNPEEKQAECDTWNHIFHQQYCHLV